MTHARVNQWWKQGVSFFQLILKWNHYMCLFFFHVVSNYSFRKNNSQIVISINGKKKYGRWHITIIKGQHINKMWIVFGQFWCIWLEGNAIIDLRPTFMVLSAFSCLTWLQLSSYILQAKSFQVILKLFEWQLYEPQSGDFSYRNIHFMLTI